MYQTLIEPLLALSRQAGEAIMTVYTGKAATEMTQKSDRSPVTAADMAAHQLLITGLATILPNIPILSEEGDIPSFEERQQWPLYWLILKKSVKPTKKAFTG